MDDLEQQLQIESEAVDDSFLEPEDKKKLLAHIKQLYETKFTWADAILIKCMVKHHYNLTVGKMNKEDYLAEKKEMSLDDFLDQLG